jgi:hypothetical protein
MDHGGIQGGPSTVDHRPLTPCPAYGESLELCLNSSQAYNPLSMATAEFPHSIAQATGHGP